MSTKDKYPDSVWHTRGNYTAYHTNGGGMIDYDVAEKLCKTLPELEVYFHDSGMLCTHNMPCPVCKTNHATFISSSGYFTPCGECEKLGYEIVKWDKPWHRKLFNWLKEW